MKRFLLLLILTLLVSISASGQSTTVTLSVTDTPDSQNWNNGTYQTFLVGVQTPSWPGGAITITSAVLSLSATGTASFSLPDNNTILPSGTQWRIQVCTATLPTSCFSRTLTITGSAQTVALTPPSPRFTVPSTPQAGLVPITAYADAEISGGWVGFTYTNISSTATPRICTAVTGAACTTWAAGGGITSPSSLSNKNGFFLGYMGLAPQDCGNATCTTPAIGMGDGQFRIDGGCASNSTVTSATGTFSSTTDIGKILEIPGAGPAGASLSTTIVSVNSATSVQIAATCSATVTGQTLWYSTNHNAGLQNWIGFLSTKGNGHFGYIPAGGYYYTAPLVAKNSSGTGVECNGIGNALSGSVVSFIPCSLIILGSGSVSTILHPATAGAFNWGSSPPSGGNIVGALDILSWGFANLSNFAIVSDQTTYNTTALSAFVPSGLAIDTDSHTIVSQIWIQGFHNTGGSLIGLNSFADFENTYWNDAVEGNDVNRAMQGGVAATIEKLTEDTMFYESPKGGTNYIFGLDSGTLTMKQIRLRNINLLELCGFGDCPTARVQLRVGAAVTTFNKDDIVLDGIRENSSNATNTGISFVNGSSGSMSITNSYLENTNNVSTNACITIGATANWTLHLLETSVNCGASGVAINNANTSAFTYYMGKQIVGTLTGAGAANIATLMETTSPMGWIGQGGIGGAFFIANQGMAFTGGTIGTLTNWGTGAAPAACTNPPPGFLQTNCFTITSGSAAFGAAPSFIYTPTVGAQGLPSLAAVVCTADVVDINGAGGAIMLKATAQNATTVTFTAKTNTGAAFTPAASEVYTVVVRCGP